MQAELQESGVEEKPLKEYVGTFSSRNMFCVYLFVGMEDKYDVNFVEYDE